MEGVRLLTVVMLVWSCWIPPCANAQISLMLGGVSYPNNSIVNITEIGNEVNAALICSTTFRQCCLSRSGNGWFYPNGSEIVNGDLPYRRTRTTDPNPNPGRILLYRSTGTTTGIFQCIIPDDSGMLTSFYVGIYTNTTGQVTIPDEINFQLDSDLFAATPEFTLTCTSTGGPATTVSWTRGSTMLSGTSPTVTNRVSGTYESTLRVAMRDVGIYMCTVSNSWSSASRNLTVVEASPPTNLSAVQVGPTSIRVSWTASVLPVMGYRLSYFDGTNRNDASGDASATDHAMTIPQPQGPLSYTITIVALSSHLPSTVVNTVVIVVPPPTTPAVTPGAATPMSVVVSWSQQASVDSYEISFQRATRNEQLGDCTSLEHSGNVSVGGNITTHNLTGLQEFSTYFITVTAVNAAGRSESDLVPVNTTMAAPTSGPEMLRAVEISSTSITIAWDAVNCSERNSNITGYVVRFTPPSASGNGSVMVSGTGDAGGMVTIDGLTPSTQYSIQVAAVNSDGSVGLVAASLSVNTSSGFLKCVERGRTPYHEVNSCLGCQEICNIIPYCCKRAPMDDVTELSLGTSTDCFSLVPKPHPPKKEGPVIHCLEMQFS